jgi:hypothetical protein
MNPRFFRIDLFFINETSSNITTGSSSKWFGSVWVEFRTPEVIRFWLSFGLVLLFRIIINSFVKYIVLRFFFQISSKNTNKD